MFVIVDRKGDNERKRTGERERERKKGIEKTRDWKKKLQNFFSKFIIVILEIIGRKGNKYFQIIAIFKRKIERYCDK